MRKTVFILLVLFLFASAGQVDARRLYYAEEFYLYVLNLHHTNPNLARNIRYMQWALEAPFDNPVRSLAVIKTEDDFERYRSLFKMHVNLLIIDSYLKLGARFDKEHVYFFNLRYAEELLESFGIARYYYETGKNYWDEAVIHAHRADGVETRITRDSWENELYLILSGELDYDRIIDEHLGRLDGKIRTVEGYLEQTKRKADASVQG